MKMLHRGLITCVLVALSLSLTACESSSGLAPPAPKNVGESMLYGYTTNAQVRRGAADSLRAGAISKQDAQHVLEMTNTSRAALDEFRKSACPNYTTEPKDSDKPACLSDLPKTTLEKLNLGVRLADQAAQFLLAIGGKKQ